MTPSSKKVIDMELFSKTNLPMTIVVVLILWSWISLITVLLSHLF